MFRVGIIGSDNSHALAFSKLTNIKNELTGEYEFPDIRVTAIYGHDEKRTEEVAREGRIEFIAKDPKEMFSRVDAVMVVFRHGDLHAEYALPFVEAGIPTWIDKPFTIKISDAKKLIEAAEKNNTLLTGGSTCKYAYDIVMLKNSVENDKSFGEILSGVMNFPANPDSEYGGLFFYGPHLAEMLMNVFGYDVKSVITSESNGNIIAVAKYDRYHVVMNFTKEAPRYLGIIYGEKKTIVREIDISIVYRLGFAKFAEMLNTRKIPLPLNHLLAPVVLLNAIEKSLKTGREIFLDEL
ncbi:MAG: Gfo/Idh/MocA family oxidoreductase [Clostridiaceae bacterium]|nr:Gfo/Idh/MocA family oxidoreductase [Clostridiaceae bacterium]